MRPDDEASFEAWLLYQGDKWLRLIDDEATARKFLRVHIGGLVDHNYWIRKVLVTPCGVVELGE